MIFNDVDIYSCRFFTVSEEGDLKFYKGKYQGKTIDDFKTLEDLKKIIAYCFWLMQKNDVPMSTKYCASFFLKSLNKKFSDLEKILRKKAIGQQESLKKKTEELTKTTGKKYV